MRMLKTVVPALAVVLFVLPEAWAWGADVHRTITLLALDGLPADAPAWLREPDVRARAASQAVQPDRWRDSDALVLKHVNDPEHYLDVEDLGQFGLTLDTIPRLRREYLRLMVLAKAACPERIALYDPNSDPARAREWPGFVLHAVAENYARLQAAFRHVGIVEELHDPGRRAELEQLRAVVVYHIGELSHFVGDIAQPLHTSRHYNGWVGDNPSGYHWRERFHAYVDSGAVETHGLNYARLRPLVKYDLKVDPRDPWNDVCAYLQRSHAALEPLYALERDGKLDRGEGRALVAGRLSDAVAMLSALIRGACADSEPTERRIESFRRFDGRPMTDAGPAQPSTAPAE
jgi:hypothetical protein